jgi:acyl-CoA dehydrogenase
VQVANALLKAAVPAPGLFPSEHIPTKQAAAQLRYGELLAEAELEALAAE